MKSKIVRRMRTSNYVTIPPELCEEVGIGEGSFVEMDCIENKIIITPAAAGKPEAGAASSP